MKKISSKVGIFFCALLTLWGCSEDVVDTTGSIYGKVTDAQSGDAIQGATITLSPGGISRTTGSDGTYEFVDVEAEQYQVQAQGTDYVTNTKSVNLMPGKMVTADIVLTPVKKLELNAATLNFGKNNTSLSFDISNKGKGKFNWNISGLSGVDWLEVNPSSGALEGGRSCTVQVNVLREKLKENAELTLIVNADKESVSLKVTVEVEKESEKIEVSPTKLDFGTEESVLTFNVKNVGNVDDLKWNITGLDVDWITIDPMEGTLGEGKTQAVKVTLARALVKEHVKATVLVNAGGESMPIEITADEKLDRYIVADPLKVEFGDDKDALSLTLFSYYGSTSYQLQKKEDDATWLTLSKTTGTIPQYDAANPAMKETVELTVNREDMNAGTYNCTLVVKSDLSDLEVPVTMVVKEKPAREFKVQPQSLAIGTAESTTFTMYSYNGDTPYQILTKENVAWLSFDKSEGTVKSEGSETITAKVNRGSLSAGEYNCTVIVRTDLGDTEIPTTMTVEEESQSSASGTIISCSDDLEFSLVSCTVSGTKATINYTVKNIGNQAVDLALYGSSSGRSYIYDDYGNNYIFGSSSSYLTLGEDKDYGGVHATIPANVLLKGSIVIPDVVDEASLFTNISLWAYNHSAHVIFKDIAIEGRTTQSLPSTQTTGTVTSCSDDLDFTLVDCKRNSSQTVTLSYRVKNISDKPLTLSFYGSSSGKSYIYDNVGNEYEFGSTSASLTLGTKKDYSSVGLTLPAGVTVNGTVKIPNVATDATELSNVTIYAYYPEGTAFVFEDVKIR